MRYKVYNTIEKKFIANDRDFILKPNGELCVNEYGDEIGRDGCIALFFPSDDEYLYIDSVGGVHNRGVDINPFGLTCHGCCTISCEICPTYKKAKEGSTR